MRKRIEVENVGIVDIYQNWFTGVFHFAINGEEMKKQSKKVFIIDRPGYQKTITVTGSTTKGLYFTLDGQTYQLTEKTPLFVYLLAVIPIILTATLGTSKGLAQEGFYYVGGAVGGLISGFFTGLELYFGSVISKRSKKFLFCLICDILAFGVCFGVGYLIVALAK